MYIKMCCVFTQIIIIHLAYLTTNYIAIFGIIKTNGFFYDIRLRYDNLQGGLHIHFMLRISQIYSRQ